MEFIAHRINTIDELRKLPGKYGVELDLRDDLNGSIYIQHNPFEPGEDFENYLKEYQHGTMILNIKSERIEWKILRLLEQYDIKNYFFLDSSFPMIHLLSSMERKILLLEFQSLKEWIQSEIWQVRLTGFGLTVLQKFLLKSKNMMNLNN